MDMKRILKKIKSYLEENCESNMVEDISSSIKLSERGFAILKECPYFIPFDNMTHNDNMERIINMYYPTNFNFKKEARKDLNVYLYYLLERGVVIFKNQGLVNIGDYQKNPNLIYRCSGQLYIPKDISNLTNEQINILNKSLTDFKKLAGLNICCGTKESIQNFSYTCMPLSEFEKEIKKLNDEILKKSYQKIKK